MRTAFLFAFVATAVLAVGCGGDEKPRGVTVTEADTDAPTRRARPGGLAFDTVYADSGLYVDPLLRPDSLRLDSLRRDSLRADSLRQDSLRRVAAAPDFRTFWPTFKEAVRGGEPAVRELTAYSERLDEESFEWMHEAAFGGEPFRSRILALTPRDFEQYGAVRTITILVGYDAEGAVVPQEDADTESSVTLRFEIVGGGYRLVEIVPAG